MEALHNRRTQLVRALEDHLLQVKRGKVNEQGLVDAVNGLLAFLNEFETHSMAVAFTKATALAVMQRENEALKRQIAALSTNAGAPAPSAPSTVGAVAAPAPLAPLSSARAAYDDFAFSSSRFENEQQEDEDDVPIGDDDEYQGVDQNDEAEEGENEHEEEEEGEEEEEDDDDYNPFQMTLAEIAARQEAVLERKRASSSTRGAATSSTAPPDPSLPTTTTEERDWLGGL